MKLYTQPSGDLVRIALWVSEDDDGGMTLAERVPVDVADKIWDRLVDNAAFFDSIVKAKHEMVAFTYDYMSPATNYNTSEDSRRILIIRNKNNRAKDFFDKLDCYTEEEV